MTVGIAYLDGPRELERVRDQSGTLLTGDRFYSLLRADTA